MKRKGKVLLAVVSAAMLLSALTACGSGESEPQPVQESQTANVSSTAEVDHTIVRENFQSGVLLEGGENEVSFEVKRMELAEEGFVIEYAVSIPSHGYTSYGEMGNLMINGCKLTPAYYDREGEERSNLAGSVRAVVDRETMDRLNITELKSVKFELQTGYMAYSTINKKDGWEIALYPGAQDDTPYQYTPGEGAQMLLDEESCTVALTDVKWSRIGGSINGQALYFYNFGTMEQGEGERIDLYKLVIDGQEMSIAYREYYMWTDAGPWIVPAYWTFNNKEQSIDDLDLTKAELTLRIGQNKGEEHTRMVTIPLDLSCSDTSL